MQLTGFFRELGHPVAYYARLTKITGSATATIFLCQFLYWEGKQRDPDGWIYKTQVEIEEETGLTRSEQEAARKALKKAKLMEERYKGLPRRLEFRPMVQEINQQWETYLTTGESVAIAAKKIEANERVSRITESEENGWNPSKIHTALPGHYCVSSVDIIDCPARTDNLYTEITNQRLHPETNLKEFSLKAEAFSREREKEVSHKEMSKSRVAIAESSVDKINRSHAETSIGAAIFSQKRNTDFEFTYDSKGWVQLPRAKKYRLARAITVRRMQAILSLFVAPDTAEPAVEEDGITPQRKGREIGIHGLKDDLWAWEDDAYSQSGVLSLRALREYSIKYGNLYPSTFNSMLMHFFDTSVSWCKEHKNDAIALLNKYSVLDLFTMDDRKEIFGY